MTITLCRVRWHRWTVWGTPDIIPVRHAIFSGYSLPSEGVESDGVRARQTRQCVHCGIVEYRWLPGPT